MSRVPILILHASGSNRDHDAAIAVELAGGEPKIVHMNRFLREQDQLQNYAAVLLPGGFSYGDALGAGQRLALELRQWLGAELTDFRNAGKPVLGICNGFQALVKAGLLPGQVIKQTSEADSLGISSASDSVRQGQASKQTSEATSPALEPVDGYVGQSQTNKQTSGVDNHSKRTVTLTRNASNLFECRWVTLLVALGVRSGWLQGIEGTQIRCPVAHGEGRFVAANVNILGQLESDQLIAFTYQANPNTCANLAYPANPNGSVADIAGICDYSGSVVGLMPHPENHVFDWQRPNGPPGRSGLPLFKAFVEAAR